MKFYHWYQYNENQILFDKTLSGLRFACILFLRILVYLPLIVTGWMITSLLLNKSGNVLFWIGFTVLFSWLLYFVIYFLKGMIIALKAHRKWLWMLLFILCSAFVVALPVYVSYVLISKVMLYFNIENIKPLTFIFSAVFGAYVYSRYSFLTNIAPRAAYPYYRLGIGSTLHLLRLASTYNARKSTILF